ncbi:MAG: MotA/TolQ/ExbB proton channel family protein [Phycisphaerae bacterium]
MRRTRLSLILLLFIVALPVGKIPAQQAETADRPADVEPAATQPPEPSDEETFGKVTRRWQEKLQQSVDEIQELREQRQQTLVELNKQLNQLEDRLLQAQQENERISRLQSENIQARNNLKDEIAGREKVVDYLQTIFGQYADTFTEQLHVAERQRYRPVLESARKARSDQSLSDAEMFVEQVKLIDLSIDRLEDVLGGTRFAGQAVDPLDDNTVKDGMFVIIGPAGLFRSDDGSAVGTVEQPVESTEDAAAVTAFADEQDARAAAELVRSGSGQFPLDTTLGKAHRIQATEETIIEHIQKGGPVMVPILGMAGLALLVVLYKWVALTLVPKPSERKVQALLDAVAAGDVNSAKQRVGEIKGPIGQMLKAGVNHIREPRELIEEVMYENVLSTKLKLQRLLPFVAIAASSAPLLGLLGTVTGIINTFKMITVHGSGDVKMLSGGISEALITTEFGLIVAIPSLLLHAFLTRKAKGLSNRMEKTAVAFVNQVGKVRIDQAEDILAKAESSSQVEQDGKDQG